VASTCDDGKSCYTIALAAQLAASLEEALDKRSENTLLPLLELLSFELSYHLSSKIFI
jgi:hypothetical protein